MTRPTEKQLAEALEKIVRRHEIGMKINAYGNAKCRAEVAELSELGLSHEIAAEALATYRTAQQAEAGADQRCAGCDIPNGCPEFCRCQPAASSAREPMTDSEIEAACKRLGARWTGDHWVIEDADLHPLIRSFAAPTRMAGAAQGEAVAETACDCYQGHEGRIEALAYLPAGTKLYANPQAQVERKPLSDEQRRQMWRNSEFRGNGGQIAWFIEGTRAAERYHGIGTPSTASDEGSV